MVVSLDEKLENVEKKHPGIWNLKNKKAQLLCFKF